MLKFRIWLTSKLRVGGVMAVIAGGRGVQGTRGKQTWGILLMAVFAALITVFAAVTAPAAAWFAALTLLCTPSAMVGVTDARYFLV
jgi:hypothetical protein